ncbi:MAG: MOSC domain-containing protein [bacterium]|nr:MOSC domain-containing protein [bacterium]
MSNLSVKGIYCYPIKGCSGISLEKAELQMEGLKLDRRWMLVDDTGNFISQRSHSELALMKTEITTDGFKIIYKDSEIQVSGEMSTEESVSVTVWDDTVEATLENPEINKWFSDHLNQNIRLVQMTRDTKRLISPNHARNGETVSFADGYPYLIIGENSLKDLNERLDKPVPMNRFRPNIVFSGGEAYEEDAWDAVTIGGSKFRGVKRCARCQVITIDQESSMMSKEPLKTLSTYRREGNKVFFGQNLMLLEGSEIALGDLISVDKRKTELI